MVQSFSTSPLLTSSTGIKKIKREEGREIRELYLFHLIIAIIEVLPFPIESLSIPYHSLPQLN
jgi:hypothetical protein